MQFPEHVLAAGPWSISKLGVLENCSLQFSFKYTHKEKELVQFAESRVGVAVHYALELALGGMELAHAVDAAKEVHQLSTTEAEEIDARSDQIEAFVKKMAGFKRKHGVTDTCIEEKWGINSDFGWVGFWGDRNAITDAGKVFFRGMVDYALLTKNRDLIIIDHKSGRMRDMSHYQAQLRVYSLMGLARFPEARGVQCAINFVMPDQLTWGDYVPAEKVRAEYQPWLRQHMTDVCTALLSEPAPCKSKLCDWCGYRPICPAHGEVSRGPTSNP